MTWRIVSFATALGLAMVVWGSAEDAEAQQVVYQQQGYAQQPGYAQQQGCMSDAQCGPGTACVGGICAAQAQVTYVERPIVGLIVAGAIVLPVTWAANILMSTLAAFALSLGGSPDAGGIFGWGFVPVVGPWVQMAYYQDSGWQTFWGVMGGLQTLGLTMIVLGAVLRTREPVIALGEGRSLALAPSLSPNDVGLNAALTF
jgi:hypothetical protein